MALQELDEMIRSLEALGDSEGFAAAVAARAAPLLDEAVKRTARAGQAPDGKPWPRRKDGDQALEHAADHIVTKAPGPIVRMTVTGVDVFHHFGATPGQVRRQVIPDAGAEMPAVAVHALERAAAAEFEARAR